MPIGISAFLPNKLYYYFIKKNDWGRPKITMEIENNRKPLISNNIENYKGHYLRFNFDNNGLVDSVSYAVIKKIHLFTFIIYIYIFFLLLSFH